MLEKELLEKLRHLWRTGTEVKYTTTNRFGDVAVYEGVVEDFSDDGEIFLRLDGDKSSTGVDYRNDSCLEIVKNYAYNDIKNLYENKGEWE